MDFLPLVAVLISACAATATISGLVYTMARNAIVAASDRQRKEMEAVTVRLDEIEEKMDTVDRVRAEDRGDTRERLAKIEQRLEQAPTIDQVHRLDIAMTKVAGQQEKTNATLEMVVTLLREESPRRLRAPGEPGGPSHRREDYGPK